MRACMLVCMPGRLCTIAVAECMCCGTQGFRVRTAVTVAPLHHKRAEYAHEYAREHDYVFGYEYECQYVCYFAHECECEHQCECGHDYVYELDNEKKYEYEYEYGYAYELSTFKGNALSDRILLQMWGAATGGCVLYWVQRCPGQVIPPPSTALTPHPHTPRTTPPTHQSPNPASSPCRPLMLSRQLGAQQPSCCICMGKAPGAAVMVGHVLHKLICQAWEPSLDDGQHIRPCCRKRFGSPIPTPATCLLPRPFLFGAQC